MKQKILFIVLIIIALLIATAVIEFLIIKYNGQPVAVPNTPRGPESFGSITDTPLSFVVLGDSTSVGQGGDYETGIARSSARYLAKGRYVTMQNFGISGARTAGVISKQLPGALKLHPDVVLIAIGANDVTHFTPIKEVKVSIDQIIDQLRISNPHVQIILTGSPEMGSVPRFPQPVRYAARLRTAAMNRMFTQVASDKQVLFAGIAAHTGPTFMKHPELFAADKFHPDTAGYDIWNPVIARALDQLKDTAKQ